MVRIKERYLLVNILYPSELGRRDDLPDVVALNQPTTEQLTPSLLLRGVRAEVAALFGDYGSGAVEGGGLSVKYLSQATSTVILRTSRSSYRFVWTALAFMNSVPVRNGKPCVFRVVHVSGTMRKTEEEAIRRARNLIFAAQGDKVEKADDVLSSVFGRSDRSSRDVIGKARPDVAYDIRDVEMGEASDG